MSRWVRVAGLRLHTLQMACSFNTSSATARRCAIGPKGRLAKSKSSPATCTVTPSATSFSTTSIIPSSKNCASSMYASSNPSWRYIAQMSVEDWQTTASSTCPFLEATVPVVRVSIAGLNIPNFFSAINPRFARRSSSSLLPENIHPAITCNTSITLPIVVCRPHYNVTETTNNCKLPIPKSRSLKISGSVLQPNYKCESLCPKKQTTNPVPFRTKLMQYLSSFGDGHNQI